MPSISEPRKSDILNDSDAFEHSLEDLELAGEDGSPPPAWCTPVENSTADEPARPTIFDFSRTWGPPEGASDPEPSGPTERKIVYTTVDEDEMYILGIK